MFYIFIILNYSLANLLQDANKLYEDLRYQSQSLIVRTPINLLRQALGIQQLDQDDEEEVLPDTFQRKTTNRLLEQTTTTTPTTTVPTVDEFIKQGPLISLYCGLGNTILLNVTRHYCYKQKVSQAQYYDQILTDPTNCAIRYRLEYGCLCPPDWFGTNCKSINPIFCDMEQPSKDCQIIADADYYNPRIDGNPPCSVFTGEEMVDLVRTVCYNGVQNKLNHTIYTEAENYTVIWSNYTRGISALMPQQYPYTAPNPSDPNDPAFYVQFAASEEAEKQHYKYSPRDLYIDTNQLKSSLEFSIQPYVRQINWTSLVSSSAVTMNQNLTLTQMIGTEYFAVPLTTFDSKSLYGRYTFEIGLQLTLYGYSEVVSPPTLSNTSNSTPVSQYPYQPQIEPKIVYFEDLLYTEPLAKDPYLEKVARIILIILIIILIMMICLFYKKRDYIVECCFGDKRPDQVHPEQYHSSHGLIQRFCRLFGRNRIQSPTSQAQSSQEG